MTACLLRLLFLVALWGAAAGASAAPEPVTRLQGWSDPGGRATLQQVLELPPTAWADLPAGRVVERFTDPAYWADLATQAYWLRLSVPPAPAGSGPRWLEVRPDTLSGATLYWRDDHGGWHRASDAATLDPRAPTPARTRLLPLPADSGGDLLLRVESVQPFNLALAVWTEADHARRFAVETLFFGLVYGVMLVMILYNLVLDLAVRDPVYRIYSLNMLVSLVYQALVHGHVGLVTAVGRAELIPLTNALVALNCATALMFASRFIDLRRWTPRLARALQGLIVICAFGTVACLLAPAGPSFAVSMMLGGCTPLVILGAAVWAWRAGSRTAVVFLVAWTLYLLGVIIWAARWLGLAAPSGWTDWPIAIGSALEATLLSLALAWRIRLMRRERKALQEAGEQYRRLMLLDELTGVLNHRGYARHIEERMLERQSVALVAVDVDHFKQFNDAWGHPAGDAVLRQLGSLLRATIRTGDAAARVGGEEFVLVLSTAREAEARIVAERLRQAFAATVFEPRPGAGVRCTLSLGVAMSRPGDTAQALRQRADELLYAAKRAGRNRVCSESAGSGPLADAAA